MIVITGKKTIVYRTIKVYNLPYEVIIVRDPIIGGFTAFMKKISSIVVERESVKDAIKALIETYEMVKRDY